MIICPICKGDKVAKLTFEGPVVVCPKCKGEGHITTVTEEKQTEKQLLKG